MNAPSENTATYDANLSPGVASGPGAAVTHSAVYNPSTNIASEDPNSTAAVGSPGTPGTPDAAGGPSAVDAPGGVGAPVAGHAGSLQFSSMNIPNANFPANAHQVQDLLVGLPHDQQELWTSALAKLPQDTNFSTLQELQQACQQVMDTQTTA